MDTPALPSRTTLARLALALLFAAPAVLHAQDTIKIPAAGLPAGTQVARPPLNVPAAATRPSGADPQRVTVPDLSGRTMDEASRLLAAAGLEMGSVAQEAGSGTLGTVVRQQPRAGAVVAPKSGVRLWIVPARAARQPRETPAAAAQEARVPAVVGRTMEDAREALRAAGLAPGALAEAPGTTGIPGTIARQEPAAGSAPPQDGRVALWLVPARRAVMPAIMGLPLDRAQEMVRQAGLRPGEVRGTGRVIGHTFQAGQSVRVGAVVNISLGVPPAAPQVAVRPDPASPDRPAPPPAQRPPPATRPTRPAAPAAQPTIPATVQPAAPAVPDSAVVPDVRRLALAQAQASLAAAGFAAVVDSAVADSAGWTVSAQQPSPGAWLVPGGRVALLLAPPAPPPVAAVVPPPAASGLQPSAAAPAPPPAQPSRPTLWIAAAVLLIIAAGAGVQRMRARARAAPPVTGVRVALRADPHPRSGVDGPPIGLPRLRLRLRTGEGTARIAAGSPLFRVKGGAG